MEELIREAERAGFGVEGGVVGRLGRLGAGGCELEDFLETKRKLCSFGESVVADSQHLG